MKKLFPLIILLFFCFSAFAQEQVHRNAIKTTFLSIYTSSAKLIYERAIKSNQTIEGVIGIIGVGMDAWENHPKGALIRYSHKFIFGYDQRYPLHGAYLKPEFALSSFDYDEKGTSNRKHSTKSSLMACTGYQWAKHRFLIDLYFGAGGSVGKSCDTFYEHGFILWDFFGKKNENIAFTAGIKLGLNF